MRWREHHYPVEIVRRLDGALEQITADELEAAEEEGFLAGNAQFFQLGPVTRADLATAIAVEEGLIARIAAAEDLDTAAQEIEEERLAAFDDVEALWGLDIGVASAVAAAVALGGTPFASCNAGGFGGHHSAAHPHVALYLNSDVAERFLLVARQAGVGLISPAGHGLLYADRDLALLEFARATLRKLAD